MPVWDFQCGKGDCGGFKLDVYLPLQGSSPPLCDQCGGGMEKVYSLSLEHKAASAFPYTTTNLTGKPIEIRSALHLQSLCKQHGVRLRDDSAFLDEEHRGYNWRTKKHEYSSGSGRGRKGQWV